tara:strand:+ start:1 stop:1200 length:1200 start_codon:yes stop_codon:yes gene_type:complete
MSRVPSVQASCRQLTFAANNGGTYNAVSNEIRIPVSSHSSFLDTSRGYLAFALSAVGYSTAANGTMVTDAEAMIDSIRIESSGQINERVERYSVAHALKARLSSDDAGYLNVCGGGPVPAIPMGIVGTGLTHNTGSLNVTVKLDGCAFLSAHDNKALPMKTSFEIVIRLAEVTQQALWSEAEATGWQVLNPRYIVPAYSIQHQPSLAAYSTFAASNAISWSGDTIKTYVGSITAAGASEQVIQINDRSLSLLSLTAIQRSAADRAFGGSKTTFFPNACTQYNFEIDGSSYPNNQILVNVTAGSLDMSRQYQEMKNSMFVKHPTIASAAQLASGFTNSVDLKVFDDHSLALRGLNTASSASPNVLRWTGAAATVIAEMLIFATCEAYFSLQPNGSITTVV